jgi:hypothetical protein
MLDKLHLKQATIVLSAADVYQGSSMIQSMNLENVKPGNTTFFLVCSCFSFDNRQSWPSSIYNISPLEEPKRIVSIKAEFKKPENLHIYLKTAHLSIELRLESE